MSPAFKGHALRGQLGLKGVVAVAMSVLARERWDRMAHMVPPDYTQKLREGGRVVNVGVVIATGVNNEGRRESLGFDVITTDDGAGWPAFLRSLVARGLQGVALVTLTPTKA